MTLLQARRGRRVKIVQIPDERARAQCIRFGIGEGTVVDSAEPLRCGPVLVRHCNQEVCLGRNLAARIVVEEEDTETQGPGAESPARAAPSAWGRRARSDREESPARAASRGSLARRLRSWLS